MAQIFALADADNLTHHLIHLRHLCHIIRGIIGTKHHQVHRPHMDAIMRLQHITVEVLLQTVVIERGIGQIDAVQTHLPVETLRDRLSKGIYHFCAALPIVDRKRAIIILTDQVDGACYVQCRIIDGPLLTIRLNGLVVHELQEMLFFLFHRYLLRLAIVAEGIDGLKGTITEEVLCLCMYEGAHLTGHRADPVPKVQ